MKQKEILQGWENEHSFSKGILFAKICPKRAGSFLNGKEKVKAGKLRQVMKN